MRILDPEKGWLTDAFCEGWDTISFYDIVKDFNSMQSWHKMVRRCTSANLCKLHVTVEVDLRKFVFMDKSLFVLP